MTGNDSEEDCAPTQGTKDKVEAGLREPSGWGAPTVISVRFHRDSLL